MVSNPNFHMSQRFTSREPGYNIFVIYDKDPLLSYRDQKRIVQISQSFQAVHFLHKDKFWTRIIRDNTHRGRFPIYILYYEDQTLKITPIKNTCILREYLENILRTCDIS